MRKLCWKLTVQRSASRAACTQFGTRTCLLLPEEERAFKCPEVGFVSTRLHTGPTSPHLCSSRPWGQQPLWEAAPPCHVVPSPSYLPPPKQAPLETGKGRCLHTSAWTGVFVASFAELSANWTPSVCSWLAAMWQVNGTWNAYDSIWRINKMLLLLFGDSILSSIWSVVGLAHSRCLIAVSSEGMVLTRHTGQRWGRCSHPKGAEPWKLPETCCFFFFFPAECFSFQLYQFLKVVSPNMDSSHLILSLF